MPSPNPMTSPLPDALLQAVCDLARSTGDAILTHYDENSLGVRLPNKADDSPLTRADLAAHACIEHGLSLLTPELPRVSEEDTASHPLRRTASRHWLIDPLDGTREFLARNGEFTVNIALIEDDQVVWGVVHAPIPQQTYWGGVALGAWRQDREGIQAIRCVPKDQSSSPCRIVASHHHLNEATRERIERVQPHQLVQAGSSLKFCRIAEGAADLYPRLAPTCEWDTAAAQAVLEGAGGQVLDLQGHRLRYSKADVLNPHFVASAPGWAQAVL